MDLFLLGYLLLACALCKIGPEEAIVFDAREYFPSLIIPGYLILTALVSTFVVFLRKSKMRPIFTEVIFVFHFIIATVLFIFLLINKYAPTAPFEFLSFENAGSAQEALCLASEILIFGAFGLSVIYLVNYNIVLVGSIFRKVKRIYGGERD